MLSCSNTNSISLICKFNEYYMSNQSNNLLLLYILQCRSEDFIKRFEEQNNHCLIGVYSLYQLAYSNYLILSDDEWSQSAIPVIEICRKRCKEILVYLKNIIAVPTSFEYDLRKHLSTPLLRDCHSLHSHSHIAAILTHKGSKNTLIFRINLRCEIHIIQT